MEFKLVNKEELVFPMLGVVFTLVTGFSVVHSRPRCCGVSRGCITVFGATAGLFGNHWVSSSLEGAMCGPLHMLVVLLC